VAISGKIDYITDGSSIVACSNGTAMLTKITAAGCSLSCLCSAYCVVADGRFRVMASFSHLFSLFSLYSLFSHFFGPS
jgi:hydroxyethylthiazole kinase